MIMKYEDGWKGKNGFYGSTDEAFASFKEVVASVAKDVNASSNPLELVRTVKETLDRIQSIEEANQAKFDQPQIRKWIPDTLEKIAAYVAIFGVFYSILVKDPDKPVNSLTVINEIEVSYTVKIINNQEILIKK